MSEFADLHCPSSGRTEICDVIKRIREAEFEDCRIWGFNMEISSFKILFHRFFSFSQL